MLLLTGGIAFVKHAGHAVTFVWITGRTWKFQGILRMSGTSYGKWEKSWNYQGKLLVQFYSHTRK